MITSNSPDRRRSGRWPAAGTTRKQGGRTRAVRISPGRIGRWSARHPWLALAVWVAFVAGCAAAGTSILSNGSVGHSARGYDVMTRQVPDPLTPNEPHPNEPGGAIAAAAR